jgi:hypothetical protein
MDPAIIAKIATALVIEASKEGFKAITKVGSHLIGKLVSLVQDRFKDPNAKKFLIQTQENPTEANQNTFSALLTAEMIKDQDFSIEITDLIQQIKAEGSKTSQRALVNINVEDSLEVGDVIQKSSGQFAGNQEAGTNIKGKTVKIANITQENG